MAPAPRGRQIRAVTLAAVFVGALFPAERLFAQAHDMAAMGPAPAFGTPMSRMGSGTTWLPDSSPVRKLGAMRGPWMISLYGTVYAQYVNQGTKRGDTQLGVTDWEMLLAMRSLGAGQLHLHAMTSIERFVLGGSGYPLLLQNGGSYRHAPVHDRQHPHNALMELAAMYEHPLPRNLGIALYVGAVGEPALGPVAFMHRPSAEDDPLAPLGHHWQDNTHQSFGVVTLGVGTQRFKVEGSAFNARESDENRPVADFRDARLDSYAGRISWAVSPRVVVAGWMGFIASHERLAPDMRMHRYGTSILTEMRGPGGGRWSSSLIWGHNLHHHGAASHAIIHGGGDASPHKSSNSLLAESKLEVGSRTSVFARVERVQKNGEEMGFSGGDLSTLYDIRSVVLGGTRKLATARSAELSLGARGAVNFVPEALRATFDTRTPTGFAVYLQLRPKAR